ncbi:Terminal repeat-encoded protein [Staphylococcus phage Stab20]|nr:hypothetical protein [Staphylococcus phage Stab20]VEV88334.1 Terminal repeat-encoded protein [Staphylococcus phage Stab20]
MVETYYTVYHRQSMKTIKDYLSRSDLIDFLYKTWHKDISNIYPTDYTKYETKFCISIDEDRLIEAVNREGILLINEGKIVEW